MAGTDLYYSGNGNKQYSFVEQNTGISPSVNDQMQILMRQQMMMQQASAQQMQLAQLAALNHNLPDRQSQSPRCKHCKSGKTAINVQSECCYHMGHAGAKVTAKIV
jgi:hypothetical protein